MFGTCFATCLLNKKGSRDPTECRSVRAAKWSKATFLTPRVTQLDLTDQKEEL